MEDGSVEAGSLVGVGLVETGSLVGVVSLETGVLLAVGLVETGSPDPVPEALIGLAEIVEPDPGLIGYMVVVSLEVIKDELSKLEVTKDELVVSRDGLAVRVGEPVADSDKLEKKGFSAVSVVVTSASAVAGAPDDWVVEVFVRVT